MVQDIITWLLIIIFIGWELIVFNETRKKINSYENIFPNKNKQGDYSSVRIEHTSDKAVQIGNNHKSDLFLNIITTINKYLESNFGSVSDYHLMKDVIDRNREVKESEIETVIPFPQYIGLVGTMAGIFIGVQILVMGNGLEKLMAGKINALAESGITGLLGGVALAVVTSAIGIALTMYSSNRFKEAKKTVESNENIFLSWIQAELLPNLTTDMSSAMIEMTRNLSRFNTTFADNTNRLDRTLARVNTSYQEQTRLMEAIERTDVQRIATANIAVYDRLRGCTKEIGMIAETLEASKDYLRLVRCLTDKLDKSEERAKTWEEMGKFFKQEIKQFEKRKGVISGSVGQIDQYLEKSFKHLQETSDKSVQEFRTKLVSQTKVLEDALEEHKKVLNTKLEEMQRGIDQRNQSLSNVFSQLETVVNTLPAEVNRYATEFRNLSEIKRGIVDLKVIMTKIANEKKETVVVSNADFKIPVMIKIAIYIIAVCCIIKIGIESYPYIVEFVKYLK